MEKPIHKVRKVFKESIVHCYSDRRQAIHAALQTIQYHRKQLETYVTTHPRFLDALCPIDIEAHSPEIVHAMSRCTRSLHLGPMAAVAGVLADFAVASMLEFDVKVAAVENGGEVMVHSTEKPFNIGLYAGGAPISAQIGFQIQPSDCPLGVGTSSGTVGHAFSFGKADSATVFAENAGLADAAATAVCNVVRGGNVKQSVEQGVEFAKTIPLIKGAFVVRGDAIGTTGYIPKLLKISEA